MLRLIFLTFFISSVSMAFGQNFKNEYGMKIAVNYSTVLEIDQQLNYEVTNQYKYRPGVSFGAFWMHDFTRFIGIDAEATADIIGVYATSPTTRLTYYYGSLPISLRITIPDDFFITTSISPSYFFRGTAKDIEGRIESTEAAIFFDPIENLDLRFSAGVGWRNTESFILTLNFNQSLNDVSELYPLKHQYIQLGMRYFLKDNIKKMLAGSI